MRSSVVLTSFCLVSSVLSQTISELLGNVTRAFPNYNVVPDVVSEFNPSAYVNMMFTDAQTGRSVTPGSGQELTMTQTEHAPEFSLLAMNGTSDPRAFGPLVLILVDPDAPTPQNTSYASIIHFLGGNFTLGPSGTMLTNGTEAFWRYWYPLPEAGSDPHRYVLLVYPQPSNFDLEVANFFASADDSPPWGVRSRFNVSSFANQLHLGEPIAGNFFLVRSNTTAIATSTATQPSSTISRAPPTLTPLSGAGGIGGDAASAMKILGLSMATLFFALV
ncbi:phosphatidylethanolamine-binding protein [Ephemerocybe angulata]|uniref:Phosphatidylethanolamine-binding protein n=1 Tax=Ephemerocybe angulata TaxID=980116 RepID=A0A8H6IAX7_9AGAR|nr:phosphatidylethanolamine-binding protein [Tulosesus angulatus]